MAPIGYGFAPGAPKASRRWSSSPPPPLPPQRGFSSSVSVSDSDESWICSPPDTPTPSNYLSYPMNMNRGRLVPFSQRLEKHKIDIVPSYSSISISENEEGPSTPKARRMFKSRQRHIYRSSDMSDTDTDTDTDDDEVDQVRDTLIDIDIDQRMSTPSDGNWVGDGEGDEVDSVLVPSENDLLSTPPRDKGKKRMLSFSLPGRSSDGDDEAEAEGLLRVREKGKGKARWDVNMEKSCISRSSSPSSDDFSIAPSSESLYDVCKGMNRLAAHSTILRMNIDEPTHGERYRQPAAKRARLIRAADIVSTRQGQIKGSRSLRKRGHQVCNRKRLTDSAASYIALPVLSAISTPLIMEKAASIMDISMSDTTSQSQSDDDDKMSSNTEKINNIGVHLPSTIKNAVITRKVSDLIDHVNDIKDAQLLRTSKIRACYEPAVPLTNVQLVSLDMDLSNLATGIHRRPRRSHYPERIPSHSTSHLHRTSPSSLLPWWSPRHDRNKRRQRTEQLKRIRLHGNFSSGMGVSKRRDARPAESTSCISGQAYIIATRDQRKAREHRRDAVKAFNERTMQGEWRGLIGKWWGYEQVSKLSSKWWLRPLPQTRDEIVVEDLLSNEFASTSTSESGEFVSPSPERLSKRKRSDEREEVDEVLCEVQDRQSRMDDLRSQQLAEYRAIVQQQEAKEQQRRLEEEARRARTAERMRAAAVERAERRRAEQEAIFEAERIAELERIAAEAEAQAEELRLRETEEAEEVARLQRIPSPAPTENSTTSDPPGYEFPIYPVVIPRPAHIPAPAPRRRIVRTIGSPREPPAYLPDRYTNRSPPPPPPYNARTDCQTLIAPIFIEDDDEDDITIERSRESSLEPEVGMVGAFPSMMSIYAPRPRPINHQSFVDPIRAFESALELEEGDEAAEVEGAFGEEDEFDDDEEEDVVPGGAVAGVFQRVFGMVWGGRR